MSRRVHLNNLLSSDGYIRTAKVRKVNQNKEPNIIHNTQNLVTTCQDGCIRTAKVRKVNQNKEPNIMHNTQNLVNTCQDGCISTICCHQTGASQQFAVVRWVHQYNKGQEKTSNKTKNKTLCRLHRI